MFYDHSIGLAGDSRRAEVWGNRQTHPCVVWHTYECQDVRSGTHPARAIQRVPALFNDSEVAPEATPDFPEPRGNGRTRALLGNDFLTLS